MKTKKTDVIRHHPYLDELIFMIYGKLSQEEFAAIPEDALPIVMEACNRHIDTWNTFYEN